MQGIEDAKKQIQLEIDKIKQEVTSYKTEYEKFKTLTINTQEEVIRALTKKEDKKAEEAAERLEYYKTRMNDFWDKANRMLERQYGLILALKIINAN